MDSVHLHLNLSLCVHSTSAFVVLLLIHHVASAARRWLRRQSVAIRSAERPIGKYGHAVIPSRQPYVRSMSGILGRNLPTDSTCAATKLLQQVPSHIIWAISCRHVSLGSHMAQIVPPPTIRTILSILLVQERLSHSHPVNWPFPDALLQYWKRYQICVHHVHFGSLIYSLLFRVSGSVINRNIRRRSSGRRRMLLHSTRSTPKLYATAELVKALNGLTRSPVRTIVHILLPNHLK